MSPAKQNLLSKSKLKFQHFDPVQPILDRCQCLLPYSCSSTTCGSTVLKVPAEYKHNTTAEQALCLQRFPSRLWYGQCKFSFDEPGVVAVPGCEMGCFTIGLNVFLQFLSVCDVHGSLPI